MLARVACLRASVGGVLACVARVGGLHANLDEIGGMLTWVACYPEEKILNVYF